MPREDEFFRQLAGGGLDKAAPPPTPPRTAPERQPEPHQDQDDQDDRELSATRHRHPLNQQTPTTPPRRSAGDREPAAKPRDSAPPTAAQRLARLAAPAGLALAALAALVLLLGGGDEPRPAEPTRNSGERGGSPAAAHARLDVRWQASDDDTLRARWRRGAKATVAGRLTTRAGEPVAGARVSVLAADATAPRQGKRTVGELRSDRRGRFRAAIALDQGWAHQLLSFRYLDEGDTGRAALGQAELRVYAPITLAVTPLRSSRGGRLRLRGRSAPGAAVRLLTSPPGGRDWRRLVDVTTTERGRWEAIVRIPADAATGRYRFRARAAASAERGFLAAASRPERLEVMR